MIIGVMVTTPKSRAKEALTLSNYFPKRGFFPPVTLKSFLPVSLSALILGLPHPSSMTSVITFIQFRLSVFESVISSLHIQ